MKLGNKILLAAADTEPPPTYGMAIDAGLVAALGKSQGRIRILLNLARVLAAG